MTAVVSGPLEPARSLSSLHRGIQRRIRILGREFTARGYGPKLAPMYAQMLVGMGAFTGNGGWRPAPPNANK